MLSIPRFHLSLALAGWREPPGVREQSAWAAEAGFRAVQLNAAAMDARPRDLDRSARRDLSATLRRNELTSSGVDLWIPPAHFTDPARADRAADAVSEALVFAADLASLTGGRAVVCVTLPDDAGAVGVVAAIVDRARAAGTLLADASWPQVWTAAGVAACVDPATIIAARQPGVTPAKAAASLGAGAACLRLSDTASGARVEPGAGELDLLAYAAALSVIADPGPPVLDLRGVDRQHEAARNAMERCGITRPRYS